MELSIQKLDSMIYAQENELLKLQDMIEQKLELIEELKEVRNNLASGPFG